MSTFKVKQSNYHRQLTLELTDISTVGATAVRFRVQPESPADAPLTVDRDGTIDGPTRVSLRFQAPELDTLGRYNLEISLTYPDGRETVPTEGFNTLVIGPELG